MYNSKRKKQKDLPMEIPQVIEELKRLKVSKYEVCKVVGCRWPTVNFWYKKIFAPSKKFHAQLKMLLRKRMEAKHGK
jgi:hypothetical protein